MLVLAVMIICAVPLRAQAALKNRLYTTKYGFTYYFNSSGKVVKNALATVNGVTYGFDRNGRMYKSRLFTLNKKTYYALASGAIAKNRIVTVSGKRYFFGTTGARRTGWANYNNKKYYFPASGAVFKLCWKKIGNYTFWFTSGGYVGRNAWVQGYYINRYGHRISKPLKTATRKANNTRKVLRASLMLQNPELPTGCETVALTMALNYYGFNIPKTLIAKNYLPLTWDSNWVTKFVGDPFTQNGDGIASPGLAAVANRFLKDRGSALRAYDICGCSFTSLYKYIDDGTPVVVWNSIDMRYPTPAYSYTALGKTWTFFNSDHCVLLCGYDKQAGKVLVYDSLAGIVWRDAALFAQYYNRMGKMAVVIR